MNKMRFSSTELKHLFLAWIGISIAFGIVIAEAATFKGLIISSLLAAGTVGIGFLFHELAHKYFAQKYRCMAEFRANFPMILLAVIMSFFGFVFAAPGAVHIFGMITKKQNGIISLAGPLTNIIIALLFIPIFFLFPSGIGHQVGLYGIRINAFLALFNMIPLWTFDGHKIFEWNKYIFSATIIGAGILTGISYAI